MPVKILESGTIISTGPSGSVYALNAANSATQAASSATSAASSSAAAGTASGRLIVGSFAELTGSKFTYDTPGVGEEQVAEGDVITWAGPYYTYEVLTSGATDEDLTGAGGVKMRALPKNGVYVDVQFGVTGDGSAEQEKLRKGLARAAGAEFLITKKVYVDASHEILPMPSNTTLRFALGAEIELLAHNTGFYEVISIFDVEDVTVIGAKINGRRDLNSATTGEFGHAIMLRGARGKTRLIDCQTDNCWGDGMVITGMLPEAGGQLWSDDVHVVRHRADNNRRQGMSIISVKKIVVDDPVWTNTNGTAPMYGCDIEPNTNDEVLEFVRINNPYTENNFFGGIGVFMGGLCNGLNVRRVDIQITGHQDFNSGTAAFRVGRFDPASSVYGVIKSVNPVWREPKNAGFLAVDWGNEKLPVILENPVVMAPPESESLIFNSCFVLRSSLEDWPQGNIKFNQPRVYYQGQAKNNRPFYVGDFSSTGALFSNIVISNMAGDSFSESAINPIASTGSPVINVEASLDNGTLGAELNSLSTIGQQSPLVYNAGANEITYNLVTGSLGGMSVRVRNDSTGSIRLNPPSGGKFLGAATDQFYKCATSPGHLIKVTPLGGGVWRVDALLGSWTLT